MHLINIIILTFKKVNELLFAMLILDINKENLIWITSDCLFLKISLDDKDIKFPDKIYILSVWRAKIYQGMWLKISHSEISNITGGFTNRTYLHLHLHLHVLIKNINADIIYKGIWSSFYLLSLLNCYSSSISVERVTSVALSSRLFEKRKEKKLQSIVNKRRYWKKNFQGIRIILHR